MAPQLTILHPAEIEGIGLHTAVRCHLRILPAPADTGVVFRRVDLDDFEIPASIEDLARVSYATSLMKQGVLISTTEHLLAALYSCGVDNVYVELDAIELPILDGSSQPFIEMLERAGTRRLRRQKRYIKILKALEFKDGDRRIGIYPADEFRVRSFVDYNHPAIGPQDIELTVNREAFTRELAPARTFGFVKDFLKLQEMGLIRGGSLSNAIVLDDTSVLNPPLRFPDEFGRHKALDVIGDLALIGRPLLGSVVAYRAGHSLHTHLVTTLLEDRSLWVETTTEPADARAPVPASASFITPVRATAK